MAIEPQLVRLAPNQIWRQLIIRNKDEEESSHQEQCNGRNVDHARQRGGEQRCMPALRSLSAAAPPQSAASLPCGLHRDIHREAGDSSDIYVDRDQKHLLLLPGDSATAHIRQPHRFADDHDEPVIFTIKTEPAGGVVKAFQFGLRDCQRQRRSQRWITQEFSREAGICQDHPRLPARFPTDTSENRF